MKKKILFLCIHNSARSQMAEAYMNQFGSDRYIAESAGIEAGHLNPFVVKVMMEEGLDISHHRTKSVFDFHKQGKQFDLIVTVCDEGNAARCPVFPGLHKKLSWHFDDPSAFNGTEEDRMEQTRKVRDQIKEAVIAMLAEEN